MTVEVRCEWCGATVALDDQGMLFPHVNEDGASCPGSHSDDYDEDGDPVSSVNRKLVPVIVLAGIGLLASLAVTVLYVASLISAMFTS